MESRPATLTPAGLYRFERDGYFDDLLGMGTWSPPKDWGLTLVTFPEPGSWELLTQRERRISADQRRGLGTKPWERFHRSQGLADGAHGTGTVTCRPDRRLHGQGDAHEDPAGMSGSGSTHAQRRRDVLDRLLLFRA